MPRATGALSILMRELLGAGTPRQAWTGRGPPYGVRQPPSRRRQCTRWCSHGRCGCGQRRNDPSQPLPSAALQLEGRRDVVPLLARAASLVDGGQLLLQLRRVAAPSAMVGRAASAVLRV